MKTEKHALDSNQKAEIDKLEVAEIDAKIKKKDKEKQIKEK